MEFRDKLQKIRKDLKLSQEEIAEKLDISRQAVAKWEAGQVYPEIDNLIKLSNLFQVTIDSLIKNTDECSFSLERNHNDQFDEAINFLCEAKKVTYAGKGKEESISSRSQAHDLKYESGCYQYLDTYFGGEKFVGEETVWENEKPIWAMNYSGRSLEEQFSGDFLKEALLLVPKENPYRGPNLYRNGDFTYYCSTIGEFDWFQGVEEIYYSNIKVYECYFHGGIIK